MTAEFSLVAFQDALAAKFAKYLRMGRRGNFQVKLLGIRAERQLVAAGYTDLQAYHLTNDAYDMADLAVRCEGQQ